MGKKWKAAWFLCTRQVGELIPHHLAVSDLFLLKLPPVAMLPTRNDSAKNSVQKINNKRNQMSHITLWLSPCQHIHTNRERREEGNRSPAALTRTLTAASSPYITAQADWREKPFGFITALETVGAGSEPTLLATAILMSWLNIQVGIWRKMPQHTSESLPRSLSYHLSRQEQPVG